MRRVDFSARNRGFTLIEIVLVIAIGVVFMGGAAMFLTSTGGDKEVAETRKILEEAAGDAREKALATGQSQRIVVTISKINGQPIPKEVEMSLSVAGRKKWTQYEQGYQWLVTGGGLVEPIRVRLRHGDNMEQFSFGALTGESVTEKPENR
jgi:prepilin-type N-terminal cleavage/methylation domain-containing protein